MIGFVIALFALLASSQLAPLYSSDKDIIDNNYIVVFKNEMSTDAFEHQIENVKSLVGDDMGHVYKTALRGFSAKLNADQLLSIRRNQYVEFVEVDQVVRAIEVTEEEQQCSLEPSDSWGQTRVSQRQLKLNGQYFASVNGGKGVTAYIVDTGIYVANTDFQGRAVFGFKASPTWSNTDANGHGTHVASTVGGKLYGIAKNVNLVAVKVLGDNGSGSNSGVIAGIDYVAEQRQSTGKPSTANLSLGGGKSVAVNAAVDGAVAGGTTFVVAAGNDNSDACNYSPASAPDAITVGATDTADQGVTEIDVRSTFSNYGRCVDIFGPGTLIKAAWIGSTTATRTISGTSMASPHVCGVASLFLGDASSSTPAQIFRQMNTTSNRNMITMNCGLSSACSASPNSLVFNGCGN